MRHSVFGKALWDSRRSLPGWVVGVTAIGVLYAAFYPSINTPAMAAALEAYPEGFLDALGFTDFSSPAGYLGATTFGLLGPALVIIMAASIGSGAIAGDEQAGRLDLTLAHPVSRWSVALQRFGALIAAIVIACAVLGLALIAISGPAGIDAVPAANYVAAAGHLALLGVLFGGLALGVGAASGRRSVAVAVVAVVAVVGYFGNNLGPTVGLSWLQDLSPFHYYSGGAPLRNGFQAVDALVLAAASLIVVGLGGLAFDRRDVAV